MIKSGVQELYHQNVGMYLAIRLLERAMRNYGPIHYLDIPSIMMFAEYTGISEDSEEFEEM